MRLALVQEIPAAPDAVWPHVTTPGRMNAWSGARVVAEALGDEGLPDRVGALRRVTVRTAGLSLRLREVIEHAEPPHRLVYRVFDSPPLRQHRGELRLERSALGTRLRWCVDSTFTVPGMGRAAGPLLERQLRESLARLPDAVRRDPAPPAPSARAFPGEMATADLWDRADAVLEEQRILAARMERVDDPKRWFTKVYAYVTEAQLQACRSGRVTHAAWVLRLIPRFHHYYASNLERWIGDRDGWAEAHWRRAYRAMESRAGRFADPAYALFAGLLLGVRAHIEEDLPRALAEVYLDHYRGPTRRCDYARFRADYLLMGAIFREASDRLLDEVPRGLLPWYVRLARRSGLAEAIEAIQRRRFYDIGRARERAFERGAGLCDLLAARTPLAQVRR